MHVPVHVKLWLMHTQSVFYDLYRYLTGDIDAGQTSVHMQARKNLGYWQRA